MKFKLLIIALLAVFASRAAVNIHHVEPAFWYAGMKNPSLQIMVYGKDVKHANVTTS